MPEEIKLLADLERDIESNLEAAIRVAIALGAIRERRLYREQYDTFEAYCRARWEMPARSVHRLIREGEVLKNLGMANAECRIENAEGGPGATAGPSTLNSSPSTIPSGTSIVRPLIGLSPADQRKAWAEAVAQAPNGKPTRALVERVAAQYKSPGAPASPRVVERAPALNSVETTEVCGMPFLPRQPKSEDTLKRELQARIDEESGIGPAQRNEERMKIIAENLAALELRTVSCPKIVQEIRMMVDKAMRHTVEHTGLVQRRGAVRDPGRPLGKGNFRVIHRRDAEARRE